MVRAVVVPVIALVAAFAAAWPLFTIARNPARRQAAGAARRPRFEEVTERVGIAVGGDAACWVDVDNDGWVDLCTGGAVWKNEEGKRFRRVADVGPAAVAADFDNDGYVDLFSISQMKLYRNRSGAGFEEVPLPALPKTVSRGACWGDFNNDGFVDIYVGGYEDWDADITYPSMILLNEGGKAFKLQWTANTFRTRGVTACDFNQDGRVDVYISNYRLQPNQLWINDGKARFEDRAPALNAVATSPGFEGGHSIGACWGDFDGDGRFDLFAGNFAHVDSRGDQPKSRFLQNLGPKAGFKFEDRGPCGIQYQESYATPAAGDFDNDGKLDLFFTTVYGTASFNRPNFPVLFQNGGEWKFTDITDASGLAGLPPTYQAAWADFDHDGWLDLAAGGKLFRNVGGEGNSSNRWLEIRLEGDGKVVNRSAIGAQVRVKLKTATITRQVEAGTGEGNQNDLVLHFGLGEFKGHVNIQVFWPNGRTQNLKHVAASRVMTVRYGKH